MTYAVIAPTKINGQTKVTPTFFTDDVEEAKKVARENVEYLNRKGFKSWAKKVKIVSPKTPKGLIELADQALEYGQFLDWNSQGNSFVGVDLINWSNTLRVRADEIANPEVYAD